MAYARRTKTKSASKARSKSKRPATRATTRRSSTWRTTSRTGRRASSSPRAIRIELVQAAPQDLSPVTKALMAMGRVTPPPRKAKF